MPPSPERSYKVVILVWLFWNFSFGLFLRCCWVDPAPAKKASELLTLWDRDEKIIRKENKKSQLLEQTKSPSPSLKIVFLTSCLCICFSYPLCLQLMTQFFLFPVLGNQRRWVWMDWSQSPLASGTRKGFMAETNFLSSSPFHAGKRSCKNGNKRSEKPLEAKGTWSLYYFFFFLPPPFFFKDYKAHLATKSIMWSMECCLVLCC